MSESNVLTKADLPEIVKRYADGESLQTLAKEARVNRTTIYRWMLAGLDEQQHHELVTNCLVNRVSDADEMLETAPDACNISRAREIARFARMDLERRRPHLYGPKQETKTDVSITVVVQTISTACALTSDNNLLSDIASPRILDASASKIGETT